MRHVSSYKSTPLCRLEKVLVNKMAKLVCSTLTKFGRHVRVCSLPGLLTHDFLGAGTQRAQYASGAATAKSDSPETAAELTPYEMFMKERFSASLPKGLPLIEDVKVFDLEWTQLSVEERTLYFQQSTNASWLWK